MIMRVLVVDDEPLAREGLRIRLADEPGIDVVGEAADGPAAVRLIESLRPDLVFLDVQMPGMDGFQVLEAVAAEHLPLVVFVTAYDRHAVRAFEVHAIDYLLKPVAEARLREAVSRSRRSLVRERDRATRSGGAVVRERPVPETPEQASPPPMSDRQSVADLLDSLEVGDGSATGSGFLRRFTTRVGDRHQIVRAEEVEWIGAAGNYVELHIPPQRSVLVRMTLQEVERRLDPSRFVRVHRSAIVNVERIDRVVPEWHGDDDIVMRSGAVVRMSRRHRLRLRLP